MTPPYPALLPTAVVAEDLVAALRHQMPLSVVRLGDGEALTLAQEILLPVSEVSRRGYFLPKAGVVPPDLAVRDRLAAAVREADIVGVSTAEHPDYGPLLRDALAAHGIGLEGRALTDAVVNYTLHLDGHLRRILLEAPQPRVLVAGNLATALAERLREAGARITAVVERVDGCHDVDRVLAEIGRQTFDLGLVPAGVAAVIICSEAAKSMHKVMLDFGHLADELISGSKSL